MGGDFQFDPRLKRHRIFTVAGTVLYSVSQSKEIISWASSNQKECNKFHAIQQHKTSVIQESLPHYSILDLSFIDDMVCVPVHHAVSFAAFSVCYADQ